MRDPLADLKRFRNFLASIPLARYREEMKDIKWVEQDLPKEILPLASIFRFFWEERKYIGFEEWFENFWKELHSRPETRDALEKFKKYYFDKCLEQNDWFKKGFKARMYRTWVSLLTQLDFCYMFEYVCTKIGMPYELICNAELDAKGIDAMVRDIDIGFQIAKISERKEARSGKTRRKIVQVPYPVYNLEEIQKRIRNPRTRNREVYKKRLEAFYKYFTVLENGFVVFKEEYLEEIIRNLGDFNTLIEKIGKIASELAG